MLALDSAAPAPKSFLSKAEPSIVFPIGQLVRHYKGGLYRITGQGTLESDGSIAIFYKSINPMARQDVWVRPLSVFNEKINSPIPAIGETARFTPIVEPNEEALQFYLAQHPKLVPESTLNLLRQLYNYPMRYYTGWWKVLDMFSRAKTYSWNLSPEQIIALLYMDVFSFHGMAHGVNEINSLQILNAHRSTLGHFHNSVVETIVNDTVEHIATCSESEMVLDLDIALLADSYLYFDTYHQLLYLETQHLVKDQEDFDTRRLKYLRNFVAARTADGGSCFYRMTSKEDNIFQNVEDYRLAWKELHGKNTA